MQRASRVCVCVCVCRTQVLDCAGKLSPLSPTSHLTPGVVPFMQAHRGVLVSFHRCLAVEFKLKKKKNQNH